MAKQTINIGSAANDGTGSTLRESFDITNDNFTELYGGTGGLFHKIEGTNFTGSLLIGHNTTGTLSSSQYNTALGLIALDALTSGDNNVAVGYNAATTITTGSDNVAVGVNALITEDTGSRNTAVGRGSLQNLNYDGSGYNVAVGYEAGNDIISGTQNTLIGALAGDALTTGSTNVAIGYQALSSEDIRGGNVAIGRYALQVQNADADSFNTAVGYNAGVNVLTGIKNVILGGKAGDALTTGSNNIIIGYEAAASAVDVSNEITLGDSNIANVRIPADSTLKIGASGDLQLEHLSGHSFIKNTDTGDLYIENQVDNGDVLFRSDDGIGGLATYFFLDGSATNNSSVLGATVFPDKSKIYMGTSGDLEIFHDGSNSAIENYTGNLEFTQHLNDGDILFKSDNMSGGTTEYIRLDGGIGETVFSRNTRHGDQVHAQFGDSNDLKIYHNSSNDRGYIYNGTGDLYIENDATDGDIKFYSDDGSGGTAQYFRVDGGEVETRFLKSTLHFDNVSAKFGDSGDFQIVHDSSNTKIVNITGDLKIGVSNTLAIQNNAYDENIASFTKNGNVSLYYDNTKKFETTSAGVTVTGSGNSIPLLVQTDDHVGVSVKGGNSHDRYVSFQQANGSVGAKVGWDHSSQTLKLNAVDTFGATHLAVDVNGNVGIGADSPSASLDIKSDGADFFLQSADYKIARIQPRGTGADLDKGLFSLFDGSTEDVRIDTEGNSWFNGGNVGIGTGSPAALLEISGSGDALRIESTNTGAAGAQIDLLHFTTSPADNDVNALINFGGYYTGTTSAYANQIKSVWTDVSDRDAELQFFTNNAGTLTKALTLDTGQNATFAGNIISETAGGNAGIKVITANDAEGFLVFGDAQDNSMGGMAYNNATNSLDIDCNNAVALSFDSSRNANFTGYVYVNTGGAEPSASQVGVRITGTQGQAFWNSATSATTGYNHFNFYNPNGVVGSIVTNGSATAFNTSSDYRLKEDLKDFDGLDKVSKIPVYDFKWKVDDSRSYGVMAHELQEVLPDAVSGEKDAEEMQGVDYSKIVPLLIKSIQELEARVKTLENK